MADDPPANAPPPVPPVLPYAVPLTYNAEGVFRERNVLVVRKSGPPLPASCVKCAGPVTHFYHRRFYWHHPALYLLLLGCVIMFWAGLLYIILALVFRQKAELDIPLCDRHESLRRQLKWAGAVTAVAGLAALGLSIHLAIGPGPHEMWGWTLAAGFAALITGALLCHFAAPLRPRKITQTHAHLIGAGNAYLDGLPAR